MAVFFKMGPPPPPRARAKAVIIAVRSCCVRQQMKLETCFREIMILG